METKKFRIYTADEKQMIERLIYPKFTAEITFDSDVSDLENIQVDEDIFDAMDLATAMREAGDFILENSSLSWFNKIVEINQNNGWVNPVYQPNNTEKFKDEFFTIKVDDFLEIESNYEVNIFRVSKRWGEIIIFCQIVSN